LLDAADTIGIVIAASTIITDIETITSISEKPLLPCGARSARVRFILAGTGQQACPWSRDDAGKPPRLMTARHCATAL
jgi:hypothetical protein